MVTKTVTNISKISKILIINPYGIGDVIFTTPLIRSLKKAWPQTKIVALLGSRTRSVLASNPYVDKIYIFDKGRFDQGPKIREITRLIKLIRALKQENFDLAIDLSNAPEYGLVSKLILKIPHRIGFNYHYRGRFLTQCVEIEGFSDKHIIEYYLDLAREIGIKPEDKTPQFFIDKNDRNWAQDFLSSNQLDKNHILVALIPGGGSSWGQDAVYKHWPPEYFARLGDALVDKFRAQVILCGDTDEAPLCRRLLTLMNHKPIVAYGRTSLGQLAALLAECDLVVSNDGGPLHIAVSVGTKTVSIFGPVDEHVYGPYPPDRRHQVITSSVGCRPCYRHFKYPACQDRVCLSGIKVETVVKKIADLISKT